VALVVARFNELVTQRLRAGAEACLAEHRVRRADCAVFEVPGAWEIPLVARRAAASGRFDAVVALGALVRGETTHFDVLASEVARGLGSVMADTGVPVGFGVLTTETVEQALDRAAPGGNKGYDAARSALELADLLRRAR
jgi:6,7-dimethyl-8-ribityllumazine synthase